MKSKKVLVFTLLFTMLLSMTVFASHKDKDPIFIGKVLEVSSNDKQEIIYVKAKGYIKGCNVYEEEVIILLNKDTKIISNSCDKNEEKVEKICVGDNIYAKLDKAMTKSIPPQVVAKKIQITKVNN